MSEPIKLETLALGMVLRAIEHWKHLAPDAPLERFLAQEVLTARAEAQDEAGWHMAARVTREASTALGDMEIETQLSRRRNNAVHDGHSVSYHPWTDGYSVGFQCKFADGRPDEYIYLTPSTVEGTEDKPNVFLYQGKRGSPSFDSALHHYLIGNTVIIEQPTTQACSRCQDLGYINPAPFTTLYNCPKCKRCSDLPTYEEKSK